MRSSAPHGSAMEIGIELSKCIHIYIYLYIHPITNLGEEWRNADCYGVTFLGRPGPGLIMQKTGSLLSSPGWSILLRCLFSHIISASKISAKKLHKQHIQHPHHHFFWMSWWISKDLRWQKHRKRMVPAQPRRCVSHRIHCFSVKKKNKNSGNFTQKLGYKAYKNYAKNIWQK
jgi:hypothetical protein